MKIIRVLFAMMVMTASAIAATTTLSGSAVDSDSIAWAGGSYTLTFVYNAALGTPVVNGQAFTLQFTGTLDGTGSFSQAVTSTTGTTPVTTPPASGWAVTVCPAIASSTCYTTAPLAVTGATQSVTAQISAIIKPPRITAIGIPSAYADIEVPAFAGNQYYRVTDSTYRCYTDAWGDCGGGGGGGGSVISVAMTAPSWLEVDGSPITTSGTISLSPASAQASHQVIGTCGTATTFAPCVLQSTDIPALPYQTSGSYLTYTSPSTVNSIPKITSTSGATGPSSITDNGVTIATAENFQAATVSAGNIRPGENNFTNANTAIGATVGTNTVTLSAPYIFTIASGASSQHLCLIFVQAATGGPFTVTPPANILGFFTIGTIAGKRNQQCYNYSQSAGAWVAESTGIINM